MSRLIHFSVNVEEGEMKLIGRADELAALGALEGEGLPVRSYLWQRRVGKTSLIKAFSEHHHHVYFLADKTTESENLKALGKTVGKHYEDSILEKNGFKDWYDFFEYLKQRVSEKTIFPLTNSLSGRGEQGCFVHFSKRMG